MALKDLKSDLSKFRRPIEKPILDKKRVEVPKSTNQTPLSQFVDKTPSAPKSSTTTPKQGVTPNKFDNSSQFLGETSPSKVDNSSQFLGETTPTKMTLAERFLGETKTQPIEQGDKFKGETTTDSVTQGDKFKGETTPSEFKFTQQFLGQTTPSEFSLTSQFLGETTPTTFESNTQFLGETDPTTFTFNPNLESQGKDPKFVDFITNDDARGFSPFQQPRNNSTFVGVDPSQTQFDGLTPISGQFVINQYGVNLQNDGGLGTSYTDSVLKTTYNKFNLKEDSYNSSIFKQPFILSGIQREKGEPQTIGFGSFSFIRGGAVTAATRAAVDVVRMSQFLLTPRGITWMAKQEGMQRSQRWGKTFTPTNLLASLAGQHLGLRFDRPGKQPLGDETWKYQTQKPTPDDLDTERVLYPDGLAIMWRKLDSNNNFVLKEDARGGFDSFYGIGTTQTTRVFNTRDELTNDTITYSNPYKLGKGFPYITYDKDPDEVDVNKIDKINNGENLKGVADSSIERKANLLKSEGQPDIKDYEFMSYGKIQKRSEGPSSITNDFREDSSKQSSEIADQNNYQAFNVETRVKLPSPGKVGVKRVDWSNLSKGSAGDGVWDKVQGSEIGDSIQNDLVHLFFYTDAGDRLQFRGTANGITETFSPSWNSQKYTGRADKAYMYSEFERTLTFNFKAYAGSRVEMKPLWKKLQRLATFTMPEYSEESYNGKIVYLRLGNLYGTGTRGIPTIITSLNYTMSDEVSWDISPLGSTNPIGEIPKMVDIAVGVTLLPEQRYEYGRGFYSPNWL